MRSPIEMLVDQACGYDPATDSRPAKPAMPDAAPDVLLQLADAAEDWLEVQDLIAHVTAAELEDVTCKLADAVRAWRKIGGGKGEIGA